jgi:hypothetical protein
MLSAGSRRDQDLLSIFANFHDTDPGRDPKPSPVQGDEPIPDRAKG